MEFLFTHLTLGPPTSPILYDQKKMLYNKDVLVNTYKPLAMTVFFKHQAHIPASHTAFPL